MNYCLQLPHWLKIVGQWLYDWQTLIAGLLAISGALYGAYKLNEQTRQAARFHKDELSRRHNAARVVLPLALSEIAEFCQKIADNVTREIETRIDFFGTDQLTDPVLEGGARQLPNQHFPDSSIAAFQIFVETLLNEKNIRHVAELISSLQILYARYLSANLHQVDIISNLYGLLLDAAKVQLLTDAMFNYARFVDESLFAVVGVENDDVIWDKIRGHAIGLVFFQERLDQFSSEIVDRIRRYKEDNISPWNEKFAR